MSLQTPRYAITSKVADGWQLSRALPASRLNGANGLRTGNDGRIYVAQVAGSQISAVDPDTGEIETISRMDGHITAPDDLAIDDKGNIFATEITLGQVSMLSPDGDYRVLNADCPVANPITLYNGRLIAGECRPGGDIYELDITSGEKRIIKSDVPMPNAFEVGADGKLYAPIMGTNEIWKIDLDSGAHEVVAADLGVPDSVKFDSQGRIVSTQVASGQVLRLDIQSGARELLADLGPGLDNVTFVGDRIFVSSIPGELTEILSPGKVRHIAERGLQWPTGIGVATDGTILVGDGAFNYFIDGKGSKELAGMIFSPGFPGWVRAVTPGGVAGEWIVSTADGNVASWKPATMESEMLTNGLDLPCGVALAADGSAIVAEMGTGCVHNVKNGERTLLAKGLDFPTGIAIAENGDVYASEAKGGRIACIKGGKGETILDGLQEPQGIAIHAGKLYVIDIGTHSLTRCNLDGSAAEILASALPVGSPVGSKRPQLGGVGNMTGPMHSFTAVAVAPDGAIYMSGDAEGSVLKLGAI